MGLFARETAPLPDFTSDFIVEHFQKDGMFDVDKTKKFAEQLHDKRVELQQMVFDTRFSEKILREVHDDRKARKNAHKKSTFGAGNVIEGLDKGILPKVHKIVQMVENNEPHEAVQQAAEDFVRTYATYEMPNALVTRFNQNNQVLAIPLHVFPAWSRRKEDAKAVEARNLVVDPELVDDVSEALRKTVLSGHRLLPEETNKLKESGFDISRLNPGATAFWSRPSDRDFLDWQQKRSMDYPQAGEKVIYQGPRYRSSYSTKLSAYTWRDGRKNLFKIKFGQEVHSEIIVTLLRQHLGFHQDHMRHFPEIKMYLGDKSYMQFERDLQLKYGTQQMRRHILKRGVDEETGEPWVVLRDVAIEARPASQVRVSPVDYGAYDGSHSREVRASVLMYAFLAQGDRSTKNYRSVLVLDDDGEYHVEYRMHDVGTALGRPPALLRRPRDILNFPLSKNKPEEYDRHYIWSDRRGNVSFLYNDFWYHLRDHANATFSDLKWAARLIASLTKEEILESVVAGGIPHELVESYIYRITNMRNRAIKAFGLKHGEPTIPGRGPVQFDVAEVPKDVARHNGTIVVKNGKIVAKHYPDSTIMPVLQQTWFTRINGLLTSRSIGRDIGGQYLDTKFSFMPVARLQSDLGRSLWRSDVPLSMTTFSVGVGINATVARIVEPNTYYCPSEGRSRAYVVRDTISFSVGVNSAGISSALARFGPELSVSTQLLRKTVSHIHFSESVFEGYRSPVQVHKITEFGNIERLAITILTPGDLIFEYKALGARAAAHLGFGVSVPHLGLASFGGSTSFEAGQTNWSRVAYTKDQIGSIHMLLEKDSEKSLGAQTEQFNVRATPVVNAAAFALGGHKVSLKADVWNIEVKPEVYDLENATNALHNNDPKADELLVKTLKTVRQHPHLALPENHAKSGLPENVSVRYHYTANKSESRTNAQLLYALSHDSKREATEFAVETPDYSYRLHRKSRSKRGYQGIENTILNFGTQNVVVRQGTSKRVTVEMDRDNPASLVVWVDVFDYHNSLTRPGLLKLLTKLNSRYSKPGSMDNFFADPPETKLEPYRRIYANARIYVNGDKLLKLVQDSSPDSLWQLLRSTPSKHKLGLRVRRKVWRGLLDLRKAVEALYGLHDPTKDDKCTRSIQNYVALSAMKLVDSLYQSKWGVVYLHNLLGEDGMLVVAEVFGIHERSNMLQDPDWVSRLRFAGKSWGKLTNVPPVSRFVRVEQPTPANEHHVLALPFERFLGSVVTGYSGGYVGLGSR